MHLFTQNQPNHAPCIMYPAPSFLLPEHQIQWGGLQCLNVGCWHQIFWVVFVRRPPAHPADA